MKSTAFALAIFFFFSILLFASGNHARKNPEEYWKEVMKDQPMPDAIKDLVTKDGSETNHNFVKDFDNKPISIIYHGHDMDETTMKKDERRNRVHIAGERDQKKPRV